MNLYRPGPWVAKKLGGSFEEPRWVILWPDTSKGGVHMRRLDDNGQFDQADAELLAASRELLDALVYALPYLRACVPNPRNGFNSDGSIDVNCVERALRAIAKAGGQP